MVLSLSQYLQDTPDVKEASGPPHLNRYLHGSESLESNPVEKMKRNSIKGVRIGKRRDRLEVIFLTSSEVRLTQ